MAVKFKDELGEPDLAYVNDKNEVFFAMKRKGEKYGQLYYLFEMHPERLEPAAQKKFQEAWLLIKQVSCNMDIPLHDIHEVTEKLKAYMDKHKEKIESQLKKLPKTTQVDVEIEVHDHATGETRILTIGMSTGWPPKHSVPAEE